MSIGSEHSTLMTKTIKDILFHPGWSSIDFISSDIINGALGGTIINGPSSKHHGNYLQDFNHGDPPELIQIASVGYERRVADLASNSDENVVAKTNLGSSWWALETLVRDIMEGANGFTLVQKQFSEFWAYHMNRQLTATLTGLSKIEEICVGNHSQPFSSEMIIDSYAKKGDMGGSELAQMVMSGKTFWDMKRKDETKISGQANIKPYFTRVKGKLFKFAFDDTVPILIDDTMENGLVVLVDSGAFTFFQKNLTQPVGYDHEPRKRGGIGIEYFGTRALYVLHPNGFSFIGELSETSGPSTYASKFGTTHEELKTKNLFKPSGSIKLNPITVLKVSNAYTPPVVEIDDPPAAPAQRRSSK